MDGEISLSFIKVTPILRVSEVGEKNCTSVFTQDHEYYAPVVELSVSTTIINLFQILLFFLINI